MTGYYDDDDYDDDELIENGAEHKYLRRIPWPGHKKKYRYVYDPRIAAKLPVAPSPGEKVRVPHGSQAGHYEVLGVKQMGNHVVADLRHDETGHRMLVRVDGLHRIVQDVFMPPGTPPRRPSKAAAKAAAAEAKASAMTTKQARAAVDKLKRKQRVADALPRERWKVLDLIIDDNKIKDYDLRKRDQQYLAWQRREDKKPPPLPRTVGLLDAFQAGGERKTRFCCLREAFNHALETSGAKTWRQIAPLLDMLRTVPGFQEVHMPSFVTDRYAEEERELRDLEDFIRQQAVQAAQPAAPAQPAAQREYQDYTRYGVAFDPSLSDEDMLLAAVTHDFTRRVLGEEEREPGDDYEDEFPPF